MLIAFVPECCFVPFLGNHSSLAVSEDQNGLRAAIHGQELRGLTFHKSRFDLSIESRFDSVPGTQLQGNQAASSPRKRESTLVSHHGRFD